MFLGMLSDEEKQAFVVLAGQMIEADGIVVGSEEEALASLRREVGTSRLNEEGVRDTAQLAAAFSSRRSRVAALLELIGLGYSDRKFNINEKSLLSVVAHEMGVSADEVARLEDWVLEHVRHVETALAMMEG